MAGRVEQKTKAWCLGNDSKLTSSTSSTSSTVSPCPQFLPQILRQDSAHLSSMQSSPIHFPQLSISCVYSVMIVMLRSWHSSHSSLSLPAIAVPSKRTWKSWNPDDPQRESLRALQGGAPGARHMMQLDATWYELIWCTMWYDICAKQKGSRFCSESVDVSRVIWKTRQSIQKGDKMGVAHCEKPSMSPSMENCPKVDGEDWRHRIDVLNDSPSTDQKEKWSMSIYMRGPHVTL